MAALLLPATAPAAELPTGFSERVVVGGLSSPVAMTTAPDGRIFVAEKSGVVKVAGGEGPPETLLDISGHVNSHWDRGLLGIAVDRDFSQNGYLYLLYTYDVSPLIPDSDARTVARLTRVTVTRNNTASPETVLLGSYATGPCPQAANTLDCIPSDGTSHSIGTIRVDPADGTLWVGVGDSASFNGVDELAYRTFDEKSLAGKLLHIDRDGRGLPGHPFCPTNADLTQVCTKLYAKGFRNPFRFNIRPDGPPIVGDVGWATSEELDVVGPGQNMGWPCWEGKTQTPGYRDSQTCQALYAAGGDTKPLYTYPHSSGGEAIVGGTEYTGTDWPETYRNSIYFGDYAVGFVKRIRVDSQDRCLNKDANGDCVAEPFAGSWYGAVDLQRAQAGGLHYVEFGDGGPNGAVKVIEHSGTNSPPTAKAAADPRIGALPLRVSFSSAGSSDPENSQLTYDWDFGDGSAHSSEPNPVHSYTTKGDYTAKLTVSDGEKTGTATVKVSAGNTAPTVSITSPASGATYRAGDTIQLTGSGSDAEDGALTGSSLEWRVVLRHGTHAHPLTTRTGQSASFTATDSHDADSNYEITLVATDSRGVTSQSKVAITPRTVQYTLESDPVGAKLSLGAEELVAPVTRTAAVGYRTTVSAAQTVVKDGKTYSFDRWSDGGARTHEIVVPDTSASLKAFYAEDKALGKTASASSTEGAGLEPGKATDGSPTTRWSSSYTDNQWWQVDLGSVRKVDAVELNWEAAYASRYRILVSSDGTTFTEAAVQDITGAGVKRTTFTARDARYVRVQGVTRATPYGISFWDARVFGPDDSTTTPPPPPPPPPPSGEDKALGKTASASSTERAGLEPGKATDGSSTTRWSSTFKDNQWWQVDLGRIRKVDAVELNWEGAYAKRYKIQISSNGTSFTDAATQDITSAGVKRTTFTARDARYVRVLGVTRATPYGISFWDARVFGPTDTTTTTAKASTTETTDTTAPSVERLSLSRERFAASTTAASARRGTRVRLRLSEAARLRFAVQRIVRGGRADRARRRRAVFARSGRKGANRLVFSGRIGGKPLRPGRYRLLVVATDRAGNRSKSRAVGFRIVSGVRAVTPPG